MPRAGPIAVYDTPEGALRATADLLVAVGPGQLALCGGEDARRVYELVASDDYRARLDWDAMEVWFTDERVVPPGHPASTAGAARRALLDLVPIAEDAVHPLPVDEGDPDAAADRYARALPETLDLAVLVLGHDGHVAGLWPNRPAAAEEVRRCVPAKAPDGSRRLTLTPAALRSARHVVLVALGLDRRPALQALLRGDDVPARRVAPVDGRLHVIADREAAE